MVAIEVPEWGQALHGPQQLPFYPQAPLHNPADSGNEEDSLTLLPRNTVVRVIGNARCKANLVGQIATVRRAQGLGGWHFLVLGSGEEVKLQRNALEVLERPTGNEQECSEEEEEQRRQQQQLEAAARGYPYEPAEPHGEDRPRPRRPQSLQQLPQLSGGGGGGGFGEEHSSQRTRAHAARGGAGSSSQPRINLNKLQTAALKRYGTVYHLPEAEQAASREQLLGAVAEHFAAQQVEEGEVIACFLNAVKRHRMGLQR